MLLYVCSIFCYYYPAWLQVATQLDTLAEEAAKIKGATLLNRSDFLLEKLHSYGKALNLRGAMAPLFPPPMIGQWSLPVMCFFITQSQS